MTTDSGHGRDDCSTIPINRHHLQLLEEVLTDVDSLLRHPLVIHALQLAAGRRREVDIGCLIDAIGLHALRLHQLLTAPPTPDSDRTPSR